MRKRLYLAALLLLVGCGNEGSPAEASAESTMSASQAVSTPLKNINPIFLKHDQSQIAKSVGEQFQIVLTDPNSATVWEISKADSGIQNLSDSQSGSIHTFTFKALMRGIRPINMSLRKNGAPVGRSFEVHIYVD